MTYFKKITSILLNKSPIKLNAVEGYNEWATTYDDEIENGNATVFYNDILVTSLIAKLNQPFKYICDFGTGTGRHYNTLINLNPKRLVGCDTSQGMLDKLNLNFPGSETHTLTDHTLHFAKDSEIDFIFSSLTLGHIKNIESVFTEWDRVLEKEGTILLTLFHPNLAHLKTARSFKNNKGQLHIIEHYKHSISELHNHFEKNNWVIVDFKELEIDDRVKPLLEKNKLADVYPKIKGTTIVCGFIIKKETK